MVLRNWDEHLIADMDVEIVSVTVVYAIFKKQLIFDSAYTVA